MGSQPGSSSRYLYERLGDKRFQDLCGALLARVFPDVQCYPVGQRDGGRDAVVKTAAGGHVYQVKWTNTPIRNPVSWLDAAIKGEANNIKRLVREGATRYYLLTSVAGTSDPKRGSMDKLDERLAEHRKTFGIAMECWWRADIDARVDDASGDLKWTYQEMLAGVDAVRYVRDADNIAARNQELRAILLKIMATQWLDDSKVKFKQVELDSHYLTDLFVDVEAVRVAGPKRAAHLSRGSDDRQALGGAAAYLLNASSPLSLVRGEPGQGKSTLGQFLCHVHRLQFLTESRFRAGADPVLRPAAARLPLRVDLRDYAAWRSGHDPFAVTEASSKGKPAKPRAPKDLSFEHFLIQVVKSASGGVEMTALQLQDILDRFPTLIVLDGLDEVASTDVRAQVVREIDGFAARLGTNSLSPPQLIVTTRPNASDLAEPSAEMFETIALSRLTPKLRTDYLRKWADAQSIRGRDRRDLERTFRERSAEPHVLQLADNPMQLTILLYLMRLRGKSVPSSRTGLYTSYMEKFLDREADKTPAVEEHRDDLEEITAYLGWNLQSSAEMQAGNGQVATKTLRKKILNYLFDVEKDTALVDALFTAVTDRVWALTSKVQGTFEFDVQPLREFFAAKFLYDFAGDEQPDFDTSLVLRGLVQRTYWLNTARFYAGFARPNELPGILDGLAEERDAQPGHPRHLRSVIWTLLSDGVFAVKPRTQRQAVDLLTDDLSIRFLAEAGREPDVASLPVDRGGRHLADQLQQQLVDDPHSPIAAERGELLATLIERGEFDEFWQSGILAASSTDEQAAWMTVGKPVQAASRLPRAQVNLIRLTTVTAVCAIEAGYTPEAGSEQAKVLVRAVLDGQALDTRPMGASEAADLLRVMAPQHHLRRARGDADNGPLTVGHLNLAMTDSQQRAAFTRLKGRDSRFSRLQTARRFTRGQSGTVSPWGNTARVLVELYGPCWLAAEIAVTGAGLPDSFKPEGDLTRGSDVLGTSADYGRLLQEVRFNRAKATWWHETFDAFTDDLSRATWALALLAAADPEVVGECLDHVATVVSTGPADRTWALVQASSRLGTSRIMRALPRGQLTDEAARADPVTALLRAHHTSQTTDLAPLNALTDAQLRELARFGIGAWPALMTVSNRLVTAGTTTTLTALESFAPQAYLPSFTLGDGQSDFARTILRAPTSYPMTVVLAAERFASARPNAPLATVAEREKWFAGATA